MKVELEKIKTKDGIELHGIISGNISNSTVILHTHGLSGNFYENRFVSTMAKLFPLNNIAFLSYNNRGHDYIADVLKEKNNSIEFLRKGGAHDFFEDCVKDIQAWIDYVIKKGAKKIFLQGHSVGAAKITYYYMLKNNNKIEGLILISPSDDLSWAKEELGNNFNDIMKLAKKMIHEGMGDDLIPYKSFSYPMDAKTFVNTFDQLTPQSMFHFPSKNIEITNKLMEITLPIIVTLGTVEEAYPGTPENHIHNLKMLFKNASFKSKIISGAGHSYIGFEKILTDTIIELIKNI